MDVQSYCDNARIELTSWKAKLYDIVRKMEKLSTGEREPFVHQLRDLHMIVDQLSDRINQLQTECPTEWNPQKEEIEGKMSQLRDNWKQMWEGFPHSAIGG
jgi:predicted nuclease with TOPRIM domain